MIIGVAVSFPRAGDVITVHFAFHFSQPLFIPEEKKKPTSHNQSPYGTPIIQTESC